MSYKQNKIQKIIERKQEQSHQTKINKELNREKNLPKIDLTNNSNNNSSKKELPKKEIPKNFDPLDKNLNDDLYSAFL